MIHNFALVTEGEKIALNFSSGVSGLYTAFISGYFLSTTAVSAKS